MSFVSKKKVICKTYLRSRVWQCRTQAECDNLNYMEEVTTYLDPEGGYPNAESGRQAELAAMTKQAPL